MNKLKKYLALFLALAIILPLVPVLDMPVFAATSGKCGTCTWSKSGTVLTIAPVDELTEQEIKNEAKIGEMAAFKESSKLPWGTDITSVVIKEGVTKVSSYAFYNCKELASVSLPSTITSIGSSTFRACTALRRITLGDEVASVGVAAFQDCTSLTEVSIGSALATLGNNAFVGCSALSSVTISSANTTFKVENDCILEKSKDTKAFDLLYYNFAGEEVTIPSSVVKVGAYAFHNRTDLTKVIVTKNVKEIAENAFLGCSSLAAFEAADNSASGSLKSENGYLLNATKDTLLFGGNGGNAIPASVTTIGKFAFFGRTGITGITIPETVTKIDSHAFNDCTDLTEIVLPANGALTSIGAGAFAGCTSLASVTIPNNVTEIGRGAFIGCNSLEHLFVRGNNPVYKSANNCILSKDGTTLLFGCKGSTVPATVTAIGDYAFDSCVGLTSFTVPDGVTSIGDFAFIGCSNLKSVVIDDSVTEIGTRAFFGCSKLSSVTLPNGNVKLGSHLFGECTSLTSLTLPEGITAIDPWTFAYCTALKKIVVPGSVTSIGEAAFLSCKAMTEVVLPANLESIAYGAFDYCTNLTNVWFCGAEPESVSTFENSEYVNAAKHYIDNACDTTCNDCSATRISSGHAYDGICDTLCNNCGAIRTVEHVYANACDAVCNECGETRTPSAHVYSDSCDAVCNECGDIRTAPHYTASSCDTVCDQCGATVKTTASHSFDTDSCDATCNECDFVRVTPHTYVYEESTKTAVCSACGYSRACSGRTNECFWYLDGTALTIFGNGATYAYTTSTPAPWGKEIETLVVEPGVTNLERQSFYNCKALTTVSLPEGLENIGRWAFYNCTSLESVVIPSTVTALGTWDRGRAFQNCSTLTTVVIPDGIESIMHQLSFSGCTSLQSVYIPGSVTEIASDAFTNCTALTDVWYSGTEETKSLLANSQLSSATWHFVDDACDATCNECGETRTVSHYYTSDCDTVCNACGESRSASAHSFNNSCDTVCNACGESREIEHTYAHVCDEICDVCGNVRTDAAAHSYTNSCDTDCNVCGVERTITHTYGGSCDAACNVCGYERATSADHSFTNVCDGDCDLCGALRAASHDYSSACDETCNSCNNSRTVVAAHSYDDNCDRNCNACDKARSVVHIYSSACDTDCDRCAATRTTLTKHSYSFDATGGTVVCDTCKKVFSYTGMTGDCYYYLDGTALTVFGNGAMGYGTPWGTDITSVTMMEGVTKIGAKAFSACKDLTSVVIPAGVTVIGEQAFAGCTALSDLTLSAGLATVEENAFNNCKSLKNIWFRGTQAQADTIVWIVEEDTENPVVGGSGTTLRPGQLVGVLPGTGSGATGSSGLSGATWHYTSIISRSFSLHSSINANLYAAIDSALTAKSIVMRFTMNGKETVVEGALLSGDTYLFVFEGIAPQCMNDTIVAELIVDGEVWDVKSFSVRAYCDSMFAMSAADLGYTDAQYNAARAMMIDLLNYGAMAQRYMSYKTNSLANSGLEEAEAALESIMQKDWENALGSEWNKVIDASDGVANFKSANVWFDNENRLYFKFAAADITETNFFVRITDMVTGSYRDYTLSKFDDLSGGVYGVFSEPISVCNFNHDFEITLYSLDIDYKGERVETAHQTLSNYGINSYIYSSQNKQDASGNLSNMALLARACYCYGVSANIYKNLI